MTPPAKLTIVIESYAPRGKGARFVRLALVESTHAGRVYEVDMSIDDARKVLADIQRAVEP